jgi:hypothetical protein
LQELISSQQELKLIVHTPLKDCNSLLLEKPIFLTEGLPPIKLGLRAVGVRRIFIGDVDIPQDRVVHFFWEQIKLSVAVAE